MGTQKKRAAFVSIASNSLLVLLKTMVGYVTGSVSILSEALHSGIDLVASLMVYISVIKADEPADSKHPFGHGKIESLSGMVESILIILAALTIMYEAVSKILKGNTVTMPYIAIAVMGVSTLINYFVSSHIHRASMDTESIALEADAKHISTDVYSSIAVFIGLILIVFTGYQVIDSLVAIAISLLIFYEGAVITKRSINDLLDSSLPDEEIKAIKEVLDKSGNLIKNYHNLQTRKSGNVRHINLHLTVCPNERLLDTHSSMDKIEKEIASRFPLCNIMIHPEPCEHKSKECIYFCYWLPLTRRKSSKELILFC
ncbi:MAG: cation transporter [Nitrospirae bacterium]|nr:cation transporter [Nitrospirota bacterium]